jgi:glycopeptide antibiotics resistance protein
VGISGGQFRKHRIVAALFAGYLLLLGLFVFFPRPVLESGDPSAVAAFLQNHANVFYKILYADTNKVAIANFFMLTPFVLIAHLLSPSTKKRTLGFFGAGISLLIELVQRFIPGRVSDIQDFYANVISVLIGLLLIRFLHALNQRYPA